jgi:hypothetical protein
VFRQVNGWMKIQRFLGGLARRTAVVAGLGGLAILAFSALVTQTAEPAQVEAGLGPWERFLRAYIVAFCVVLSLSLGGLWFVMLQHLTKAGWSVVLRRVAEAFASNLTWLWIFFIPILIGVFKTDLYAWRHPRRCSSSRGSGSVARRSTSVSGRSWPSTS